MPTLILIDNSLSMYKHITKLDDKNKHSTKHDLANLLATEFIKLALENDKYEYVSLVNIFIYAYNNANIQFQEFKFFVVMSYLGS